MPRRRNRRRGNKARGPRYARLFVEPLESRCVLAGAAPTISALADQTIAEDAAVILDFIVADADTPLGQLQITAASGDTTLVPQTGLTLAHLGGSQWRLMVVPAGGHHGSTTVTVSVSDGETTVPEPFTLNVTSVNDAPSFATGTNCIHYGPTGPQTFAGWATSISPGWNEPGQAVTFQTSSDNPALFSVQPTIAPNGTLSYTPSGVYGTASVSVTLQDDGGTTNGGVNTSAVQIFQIQFNLDVGLDPTFDGDGIVRFTLPNGSDDVAHDVARQADGKYVAVGRYNNGSVLTSAVVRYNADGSVDATFGDGGAVRWTTSQPLYLFAIEVQADGKIVVGGTSGGSTHVARLNYDGSFDTAFGVNGSRTIATGSNRVDLENSSGLAIQADGRIVLVNAHGQSSSVFDAVIVRVTAGGAVDTSFNGTGFRTFSINSAGKDLPYDVAVQSDGKLVMVGAAATSTNSLTNDFYAARFNIDGTLDTTFGGGLGYVTVNVGVSSTSIDIARRVVLQSDGKILIGGHAGGDFGLIRLNVDGSLDPAFDSDGKVITNFNTFGESVWGLAVQTDGKIVAAGPGDNALETGDFALARYNADGSLDTSFDGDGKLIYSITPGVDQIYDLFVESDGKYVVAGTTFGTTSFGDFTVARFHADGTLDTAFGGDGVGTHNVTSASLVAATVAVLADGKLLVGGYVDAGINLTRGAVWRLQANGALDTTFGTGGFFVSATESMEEVKALVIQDDGKIVIQGDATDIGRLNADGSLDTTFGTGGLRSLPSGISAFGLARQSDGKILVSGRSTGAFALVRYTADGVLDTSFSDDGRTTVDLQSGTDVGHAVAVQPDGKIVVVGSSSNGSNDDFGVVRFHSDGTLDTSFSDDGKFIAAIASGPGTQTSLAIQTDGKILVSGFPTTNFTLLRLTADGVPDASFGTAGIVITDVSSGGDNVTSLVTASDGSFYAVGYSTAFPSSMVVAHYLADGSLDLGFGTAGIVRLDSTTSGDRLLAVALQPDGRPLVAGFFTETTPLPTNTVGAVVRFDTGRPRIPAPSVTAIGNLFTNDAKATAATSFTVSHPTLPAGSLSVSATSSNTTLIANANLELVNLGNGSWSIRATPTFGNVGSSLITVLVSDGTAAYSETFTVLVSNSLPTLTGVYAQGSAWNPAFNAYLANNNFGDASLGYRLSNGADQLDTLPWTNVNTISIQFSEPMVIERDDLTVVGSSNGPGVPGLLAEPEGFSWNATNFTATWTFASALPLNKYLLHIGTIRDPLGAALDGEWIDSSSTVSGNGTSGGNFNFRFNVLPADTDANQSISQGEALQRRLHNSYTTGTAGYVYREDLAGAGTITLGYALQTRLLVSSTITSLDEPILPGGSSLSVAGLTVAAFSTAEPSASLDEERKALTAPDAALPTESLTTESLSPPATESIVTVLNDTILNNTGPNVPAHAFLAFWPVTTSDALAATIVAAPAPSLLATAEGFEPSAPYLQLVSTSADFDAIDDYRSSTRIRRLRLDEAFAAWSTSADDT